MPGLQNWRLRCSLSFGYQRGMSLNNLNWIWPKCSSGYLCLCHSSMFCLNRESVWWPGPGVSCKVLSPALGHGHKRSWPGHWTLISDVTQSSPWILMWWCYDTIRLCWLVCTVSTVTFHEFWLLHSTPNTHNVETPNVSLVEVVTEDWRVDLTEYNSYGTCLSLIPLLPLLTTEAVLLNLHSV